jgi:hypothetical protein
MALLFCDISIVNLLILRILLYDRYLAIPVNAEDVQEELDDVDVELNGSQVGVVQAVAVLALPEHQLGVVDQVDAKEEGGQARVNQLDEGISPEDGHDTEDEHH